MNNNAPEPQNLGPKTQDHDEKQCGFAVGKMKSVLAV